MGQLDMTVPLPAAAPAKRTRKGRVTDKGIAERVTTLRKQGWICIPPRTPLLTRLMLALRGVK